MNKKNLEDPRCRQILAWTYKECLNQLRPNECLYGEYDNGMMAVVVKLYDEDEYNHFEKNYEAGFFLSRKMWAVDKDFSDTAD